MIDMKFLGVLVFAFVLLIGLTVIITLLALGLFLGKALIRYIRSGKVRKEQAILKKSLGEVLKQHREQCRSGSVDRRFQNGRMEPQTQALQT